MAKTFADLKENETFFFIPSGTDRFIPVIFKSIKTGKQTSELRFISPYYPQHITHTFLSNWYLNRTSSLNFSTTNNKDAQTEINNNRHAHRFRTRNIIYRRRKIRYNDQNIW